MLSPSLDLYAVFARVAETGSFSRAARDLGVSKATVSKRVAELEQALGVALVARTTRRASVTEAGARILARAQRILEEADAAREEASEERTTPRGRLRVTAPVTFGVRYLSPLLPDFPAAYPDIELEMSLSDARADLIGSGFDAAIRISEMEDSSFVARRLAPVDVFVVGAPAYWDARGRPRRPEDLMLHTCFLYRNGPAVWRFEGPNGERAQVRPNPRLWYDSGDLIEPALCAGLGVAAQPDFISWRDVASGRLERVLPDWRGPRLWLHFLTPPGRGAPRRLRALSDFIQDHFGAGRAPWLDKMNAR